MHPTCLPAERVPMVCLWEGKVAEAFSARRFAAFTARDVATNVRCRWLDPQVLLAQRSPVQNVLCVHFPGFFVAVGPTVGVPHLRRWQPWGGDADGVGLARIAAK